MERGGKWAAYQSCLNENHRPHYWSITGGLLTWNKSCLHISRLFHYLLEKYENGYNVLTLFTIRHREWREGQNSPLLLTLFYNVCTIQTGALLRKWRRHCLCHFHATFVLICYLCVCKPLFLHLEALWWSNFVSKFINKCLRSGHTGFLMTFQAIWRQNFELSLLCTFSPISVHRHNKCCGLVYAQFWSHRPTT